MEDNEKFDKMVRTHLNNFKMPVSDHVLANIKEQAGLNESRKKFAYGNWALSLVLIAGLVIGGYFMFNNLGKKAEVSKGLSDKESAAAIASIDNADDGTKKKEANVMTLNNNSANEKTTTDKETAEENKENAINNTSAANSTENGKQSGAEKEKTIQDNKGSNGGKQNSVKKNNENTKELASSSSAKKSSSKINNNNNKTAASEKSNAETSAITTSSDINTEKNRMNDNGSAQASAKANEMETDKKEEPKEVLAAAMAVDKDSVKQDSVAKVAMEIKPTPAGGSPFDETKPQTSKKARFFVGVTGGVSFVNRLLKTGNNYGAENRNNNEKQILTYNAGIELGAAIKDKLIIGIGIRLNNYGEKYSYSNTIFKSDTAITSVTDSNQVITHDTAITKTPSTKNYNLQNNYQMLTIPIMIGYQINLTDKWYVTPVIGIGINYLLSGNSSWLDTETNKEVVYNNSNGNFTKLTFAGSFKFDIGLKIKDHWNILLQPEYTRTFQSIYKKDDELKLTPYSYNINLGVRYKF